jgi:hypothetical protein
MTLYVFLLWFFLILCLVLLWHVDWPHHCSFRSSVGAAHAIVQRLLKPRSPSIVQPVASPTPSRQL